MNNLKFFIKMLVSSICWSSFVIGFSLGAAYGAFCFMMLA